MFWFTGMMQSEIASASGLLLMLVLGLRHGLDPDHIACIDGLTWRAMQHGRHHSPWVGTLFAIGHGLLVTMVAVVFSQVGRVVEVASNWARLFDWVPTALLLLVALLNVRQLCSSTQAAPMSLKLRLIPPWLRDHAAPWSVFFGASAATLEASSSHCGSGAPLAGSLLAFLAALRRSISAKHWRRNFRSATLLPPPLAFRW